MTKELAEKLKAQAEKEAELAQQLEDLKTER